MNPGKTFEIHIESYESRFGINENPKHNRHNPEINPKPEGFRGFGFRGLGFRVFGFSRLGFRGLGV